MQAEKNQKSFLRPFLIMTAVVFILLAAGWQLAEQDFENIVPIENVEIEGRFENLSLSEIRSKLIKVLDGGYFTINLDEIRQTLLVLPWVEDASIRRQWPSGLHIKIVEKQAVANWGNTMLLSQRGDLFTPEQHMPDPELPMLQGPDGLHSMVWSFMQQLNAELNSMSMQVDQLKLDQRRAWRFFVSGESLKNKVEIKLGREDIDQRLARFTKVFGSQRAPDLSDIEMIDLRYPNGFAMRKNKITTKTNMITGMVSEVYTA